MNIQKMLYDDYVWGLKYRPKTIGEVILPQRLRTQFEEILESGKIPNMLFYGPAGVGKTTVAAVLSEAMDKDTMYINASKETSIDTLRGKISQFVSSMSLRSDGKKLVILDEFDRASQQFQDSTKVALEEFSKSTAFIAISNHKNRIIDPLQSRLQMVDFVYTAEEKAELIKKFFAVAIGVLKTEGVEFEPKVVGHLVKQFFPDMRRTLNELQKYSGQKNLTNLSLIKTFNGDIGNFYKMIVARDFYGLQQFVAGVSDPSSLFSSLYDTCTQAVEEESIPDFIVLLGDYSYKSSFVVDQRINTMAFCIEMMNNVKVKK